MVSPEIRLENRLTLSPQLQFSLRILQMDFWELCDFIRTQALENPLISPDYSAPPNVFSSTDNRNLPEPTAEDEAEKLKQSLREQIPCSVSPEMEQLLRRLIEMLDSSGYLRGPSEELAFELNTEESVLKQSLALLQGMEPAGIGASTLEESLRLQMERKGVTDALAYRIAESHLSDVAQGHLQKIAREENASMASVHSAVESIRSLSPHPANGFCGSEKTFYTSPEVSVVIQDGNFSILEVKNAGIGIHRVDAYADLLKDMQDAETIRYLKGQLRRLNQLEYALAMRKHTMLRVAEVIVKKQKDFFRTPAGTLRALSLEDIAEEVELHPSTVSKAMQGKYLTCDHGVYPFKYFLSRYTGSQNADDGTPLSQTQLGQRILQLIAQENPCKPYSDLAIYEELRRQGIMISRRSVVNYRDRLGILCSYQRKEAYLSQKRKKSPSHCQ